MREITIPARPISGISLAALVLLSQPLMIMSRILPPRSFSSMIYLVSPIFFLLMVINLFQAQ